jgi:hypothetical protein
VTDGLLLVGHAAATWAMVGLIWFVQVVHYPLFGRVGADAFPAYEREHQRRTTWVVMVLMPVELVTGIALVWVRPEGVAPAAVLAGMGLLAVVWVSTGLWQAPLHGRLGGGYDAVLAGRLVASNWLRTAAWSLRGVLVAAMLLAG